MAYRMLRIRGTFGAAMEFRRFPYDKQQLEVVLRAPSDKPRGDFIYAPRAAVDPAVMESQAKSRANDPNDPGKDVIAGWRVVRMTASERPLMYNATIWNSSIYSGASTSDDPLFAVMKSTTLAGPQAVARIGVPYFSQALSEASFMVHVCRIPTSYLYNFVFLVTLLEMIALVSFMLIPSDLDSRVNLTLTVFLGVIFFQLMMNELLPTTGYLTDMHMFTFYATVLVVAVSGTHVTMYLLHAKAHSRAEMLQRFQKLRKSRRALASVFKVQREVRRWLAVKRLNRGASSQGVPLQQVKTSDNQVVPIEGTSTTGGSSHLAQQRISIGGGGRVAVLKFLQLGKAPAARQTPRTQVLNAWNKFNSNVEHMSVFWMYKLNAAFAFTFVGAHLALTLSIFQGAPWNDPSFDCY